MKLANKYLSLNEAPKRYAAVYKKEGRTFYVSAKKIKGRWWIGGDLVDQGYKREISIFSLDDEKIYKLQGSHLVPMDAMSDGQVKWFNDNFITISTDGIVED
jgi:hypothetical protein